jgi:tetratricopeptide (TPR) repeat protein
MQGRVFTVLHRFDLAETALDRATRSAEYAAAPDYTAAEGAFRDSIAIDRQADLPRGLHIHTRMLANVLVKNGRPAEALSLLADATEADERNNARMHTVRAKAFAALDRLAEAQDEVDSARALTQAIGATQYEYELTDIEADLAARSGAVETARALWGEITERYFHAGHPRFDVYLRKLSQLPPPPR